MTQVDRRAALAALAGLASAAPAMAQTAAPTAPRVAKAVTPLKELRKEADVACLYHCDFGDPARFSQMLVNIGNHYSAYGADPFALQLAIVAHGPGIKFFLSSLEETPWRDEATVPQIWPRVEALFKNGLRVHLCDITFQRQKVDRALARAHDSVSVTPSGVATVADLQSKGFGYIKIG
ncbi:MAG: DsrE family protein [Methylobacteriaceae bacterium]|nr:DsrE family protein [Methylobacteriaceae bacterium]